MTEMTEVRKPGANSKVASVFQLVPILLAWKCLKHPGEKIFEGGGGMEYGSNGIIEFDFFLSAAVRFSTSFLVASRILCC